MGAYWRCALIWDVRLFIEHRNHDCYFQNDLKFVQIKHISSCKTYDISSFQQSNKALFVSCAWRKQFSILSSKNTPSALLVHIWGTNYMIRLRAHGRLFETCAYLFRELLGWALIRDVRLFETCAKSSIYGIYKSGRSKNKKKIVLGIIILSIQNCVDFFVLCLGILV